MRTVFVTLSLALCCVLMTAWTTHAQTVTPARARIAVVGVSGDLVAQQIPGIDRISNGLPNVSKGDKVYLQAGGVISLNSGATAWASADFSFTETPAGSSVAFEKINDVMYSFIPDVEGTYRIEMTATDDANETGTATLVVNVAKYVGVGGLIGSAMVPECRVCHSGIATSWEGTKHAQASMRLDDTQNFRAYCLPCHTTGSLNPDSEGDGWLHRARILGWQFPDVIQSGNFDAIKTDFPELAKMAHVQCESCHGPGSAHIAVTTDNKAPVNYTASQCRQCHDAAAHHPEFQEYDHAAHSRSMASGLNTESMNRGNTTNRNSDCARCHTANGHVEVHIRGAQFSSAPYANPAGVTCIACHDPHAKNHPAQLRKSVAETCGDCHSIRPSGHSGLHNSHQGPMLKGEGGKEFPGYTYRNSAHSSIADQCVQCHMAPPEEQYKNKLGGHTFNVHWDNDTPEDRSDDVLNQNGCIDCHTGGYDVQDLHDTQDEIRALLEDLKQYLKLRPDGRPLFPSDASLTTTEADIHWNYYFVANDNSFGAHNYLYSKDLLNSAIAVAMTLSVERLDGVPYEYALFQNYPNPFNPTTEIRFSIPEAQHVTITIHDATGKVVYTLVNDHYTAGNYGVKWNGTVRDGLPARSGVYFYRITTASYTSTKKMMLVK